MSSTTFSAGTVITHQWLNDVNSAVYNGQNLITTYSGAPTLTIISNTITPTTAISFLGSGLVKTIAVPTIFPNVIPQITLIPTAAFTTDTTSNIAISSTAIIGRTMVMTYDTGTSKWYPSY